MKVVRYRKKQRTNKRMETGRKRKGKRQAEGSFRRAQIQNAKGGGWNFLLVESAKGSERGITARASATKKR